MKRAGKLELHLLEQEARRLRAEYTDDWFVRAAVEFNLALRRLVRRLASIKE